MELLEQKYKQLVSGIGQLLAAGRENAAQQINTILVYTYWEIGRYIVEYEQKGNEKAEYEASYLTSYPKTSLPLMVKDLADPTYHT